MKIFDLLKEMVKYIVKNFLKERKKKSFKENLFIIPALLALVLVPVVLISKFINWID